MTTQILQLSDFHILENPTDELRGVTTAACLAEVWELVRSSYGNADLLVMTGDIAAHGEEGAYRQVQELFADALSRCRLLPGNHDDSGTMQRFFGELIAANNTAITFSQELDGWRLIGLDSHVAGEVHGEITAEQLDWLGRELNNSAQQPTLLFLHHPPISVASEWLDRIMLRNPQQISDVLDSAPQVRAIFCGHVHHEFHGILGNVPVFTTPSTAIQFTPGTAELIFDDIPPGFRVIELSGNEFATHVVRLP